MKRTKQTEDIEKKGNEEDTNNSKSFAVESNTRFVSINLPNIVCVGKDQYKKQSFCVICYRGFTKTFRQHHCRVCANAVCNNCSRSIINGERACDLCVLKLSNPNEEKKKKEMLATYEMLCAFLLHKKATKMEEFQRLKIQSSDKINTLVQQNQKQKNQLNKLLEKNHYLKKNREELQEKLQKIRQENAQLQASINEIQKYSQASEY